MEKMEKTMDVPIWKEFLRITREGMNIKNGVGRTILHVAYIYYNYIVESML